MESSRSDLLGKTGVVMLYNIYEGALDACYCVSIQFVS